MDAYSNRLSQNLQQGIEAKITELSLLLATTPAGDHADYMQRVGRIQGLREAETIRQNAERDLGRAEADKNAPEPVRGGRYED